MCYNYLGYYRTFSNKNYPYVNIIIVCFQNIFNQKGISNIDKLKKQNKYKYWNKCLVINYFSKNLVLKNNLHIYLFTLWFIVIRPTRSYMLRQFYICAQWVFTVLDHASIRSCNWLLKLNNFVVIFCVIKSFISS